MGRIGRSPRAVTAQLTGANFSLQFCRNRSLDPDDGPPAPVPKLPLEATATATANSTAALSAN